MSNGLPGVIIWVLPAFPFNQILSLPLPQPLVHDGLNLIFLLGHFDCLNSEINKTLNINTNFTIYHSFLSLIQMSESGFITIVNFFPTSTSGSASSIVKVPRRVLIRLMITQ